jgi:hypothetical protein
MPFEGPIGLYPRAVKNQQATHLQSSDDAVISHIVGVRPYPDANGSDPCIAHVDQSVQTAQWLDSQ